MTSIHRPILAALAPVLAAAVLAGPSAAHADDHAADRTIPQVAAASDRLSTLVTAVRAAGLAEALSGEGPFTVFAPSDAAFARIDPDRLSALLAPANRPLLVRILTHHVVPGRFAAADLLGRDAVETLAGTRLELTELRGRLLVGDAVVETADIDGGNGVVHLIDRVLMPPAPANPVATLLVNAIDRGVPLFNGGDAAACAAIYATALDAVVLGDGFRIDPDLRATIAARLPQIAAMSNPSERAWAYRRIMDAIIDGPHGGASAPASAADRAEARTVATFDDPVEIRAWRTVLDGVMGGLSTGRIRAGDGTIVFDGETSLENNGGFSSMRADVPAGTFAGFDAVRLRVKGDGRTYRLGAKSTTGMRADGYWAPFPTERDAWTEVVIPIAELERHIMGQRLPGQLDPADVRSLEFYIYDKKAGPFRLEIDAIEAVRLGALAATD